MLNIYKIPIKPIKLNDIAGLMSFFMGAFLSFYIPIFYKIKIVDLFVLISFLTISLRCAYLGRATILLSSSLFFLIISTLLAQFSSDPPPGTIEKLLSMAIALLAFLTTERMQPKELTRFLKGYLFSITLVTLVAILQFLGYLQSVFPDYRAAGGFVGILGTMPDPNRYALALSCAVALTLGGLWTYTNKILFIGLYFFLILAIMMTGSRSGLVFSALLTGIFFLFINYTKLQPRPHLHISFFRNIRLIFLFTVFVICSYAAINFLLPNTQFFDLISIFDKFQEKGVAYQEDIRYRKLLSGLQLFSERPLLGYGLNGYIHYGDTGSSHNSYINLLVEGGFFTLITFGIFFIYVARNVHRSAFMVKGQNNLKWTARSRIALFYIIGMFFFTAQLNFLVLIYAFLGVLANPSLLQHIPASKREKGRTRA